MIHRVYKSLDSRASLFGIRGSNLMLVLAGSAVGAFLGLIIGAMTISIIGVAVIIISVVVSYLAVISFQSRYTEKERDKLLAKGSIPDVIVFQPMRFRDRRGVDLKINYKKTKQ